MATASAWARPGIGIRIEVADADEELGRGSHLSQSTLCSSPHPRLLEAIGQKTCAVGGTALRARQQLHIEERRKELAEKRVQSTDRSRNTLPTSLTHRHKGTRKRIPAN